MGRRRLGRRSWRCNLHSELRRGVSRFSLLTLISRSRFRGSNPWIEERSWLIAPVATRTLRHWSYLILRWRPTPRHDVRECLLEKIDGREAKGPRALFRIGESGLEDV